LKLSTHLPAALSVDNGPLGRRRGQGAGGMGAGRWAQDAGFRIPEASGLAMVRIMTAAMRGFQGSRIWVFSIFKKAQATLNFCSKHVLPSMGCTVERSS